MVHAILKAAEDYEDLPHKQIKRWFEATAEYSVDKEIESYGFIFRDSSSSKWSTIISEWCQLVYNNLEKWQNENVIRTDATTLEIHQYCDSFTYGFSSLSLVKYMTLPINENLVNSFIYTLLQEDYRKEHNLGI